MLGAISRFGIGRKEDKDSLVQIACWGHIWRFQVCQRVEEVGRCTQADWVHTRAKECLCEGDPLRDDRAKVVAEEHDENEMDMEVACISEGPIPCSWLQFRGVGREVGNSSSANLG